ncbi:MAG: aminotransferase class I/II-fold pyridoxal phosphate-dependent enzyme [Ornithinimicrobium sp.]
MEEQHGPRHAPATHHSIRRVRLDGWGSVADASRRLAELSRSSRVGREDKARFHELLDEVTPLETYWARPGVQRVEDLRALVTAQEFTQLAEATQAIAHAVVQDASSSEPTRPSFEVLVVADSLSPDESIAAQLAQQRHRDDAFEYELVFVPSLEDALIAVAVNSNVQAVLIRPSFEVRSRLRDRVDLSSIEHLVPTLSDTIDGMTAAQRIEKLTDGIHGLRPELDLYLVGHVALEAIASEAFQGFRRVFLRQDPVELHVSILRGITDRHQTPFFTALRNYSRQPTGVFHALPISRGKSIVGSPWVGDMVDFYGLNIFMAETSSTSGGLDSLLDPVGPIKKAQELASRAFGSHRTYFVTNGTSTANKIVVQSIVTPGDIVLVDRDCHKSHHYALMLAGAQTNYLDAYPLDEFSMYGAVPLETIKAQLLAYRRAGRLHEVKMLALTNCTFDGIVSDVERIMEECLAIKPDLVFLWDEAWFAFAAFHPTYRRRTGMATARRLRERFRDPAYRERFEKQKAELADADDETWLKTRLLPDPDEVRLRVYATQSTHKTLTALRQGSMIHVFDDQFGHRNEEAFREAYMTHTSTSPNYQILASLDVGRRQVELEGFKLVQQQVESAKMLRRVIASHPILRRRFRVLTGAELIPEEYRRSGEDHRDLEDSTTLVPERWEHDEFVLDPSRVTISISQTGVDGDTFKHEYLMRRHGIQVNKTSRNTVLFMTNIGTTNSSVAYLVEVLLKLAQEIDDEVDRMGPMDLAAHRRKVEAAEGRPALPDFSSFHPRFRGDPEALTPEGSLRDAFFLSYDEHKCEYVSTEVAIARINEGRDVVSATFVTPYPPGFPILVPGQVVSREILDYVSALDTREIHGYAAGLGYRVFTKKALA